MKLDNYTLPERVKAKMVLKLLNTQQEELGFALCSKDNIITTGKDLRGTSDRIEIYPSECKQDEKFLGSYHTHPKKDSRASARDLVHCGIDKIICIGGKTDNNIRCNIWKYEQLPSEDIDKMKGDTNESVTESEKLRYQQISDCASTLVPLVYEEECVEKINKDIYKKLSNILALKNKSGISESEIKKAADDLDDSIKKRYILAYKANKETETESKKYYDETYVKLKKG